MTDHRICDVCDKPMIEDGVTAFYAGMRHWDCQYPNGYTPPTGLADFKAAIDRAETALEQLRRRLSK